MDRKPPQFLAPDDRELLSVLREMNALRLQVSWYESRMVIPFANHVPQGCSLLHSQHAERCPSPLRDPGSRGPAGVTQKRLLSG